MDYSNLSDVEFEYLCKDIMSKKLSLSLERFGRGRDNGIDLTDDAFHKNVIIQVKHYVKTDVNGLLNALKKEVPKVNKNAPKQYYVCCSKELTPQNKVQIYEMFSGFMTSTDNIITKLELDEFLEAPENTDVLRKHFKLWLESTNVLTDVLSNDIFLDSKTLLSEIKDEKKYFVKTKVYDRAIKYLNTNHVLIVVGNPGVGKTITSKMIVLNFAGQGYRVRYTTDGSDLKALKKSLSQSPDAKEIILLDDCFGQAYFNMKETQENELLALIKYVNLSPNKILIMNSRISIYNEASERNHKLIDSLDRREYRVFILNMESISIEDKALIFYNHLYFKDIPDEHLKSIKINKSYRVIVKHKNYNPRIIEFVCSQRQYSRVSAEEYVAFILDCLNKPEQVWKNEYYYRLLDTDRLFLNTLYALTDKDVSYEMMKQCYNYRLLKKPGIDSSINHFEQALNRLSGSMVKLLDNKGTKTISVANPSVNDFLRANLETNPPLREFLVNTCNSVAQLKRLLDNATYEVTLLKVFENKSILSWTFENERQKIDFITYWCVMNNIQDKAYGPYISDYIFNIRSIDVYSWYNISPYQILVKLFSKEFCGFYGLDKILSDLTNVEKILSGLQLEDIITVVKNIDWVFNGDKRDEYIEMARVIIRESLEDYCYDISVDNYDVDFSSIVEEYKYVDEDGIGGIDTESVVEAVEQCVREYVDNELDLNLSLLPFDVDPDDTLLNDITINISGAESATERYLMDDYIENDMDTFKEDQSEEDMLLDRIFE